MKKVICLILTLCMVSLLVACGNSGNVSAPSSQEESTKGENYNIFDDENAPEFNMRLGMSFVLEHPIGEGVTLLADLIEERSNGKIKIEIFPGCILGGERDMYESLQLGTLDLAVGGPVLANFLPEFEIINMPFLFESREHAYAAMDGKFGDDILKKLETVGIVGLGWFENGFYDLMNGKVRNVTSWKDISGLNIRTVESNGFMDGWTAIGANPVPMAATELFTALQNGTVDGICLSINGTYYLKLHEAKQVNYTTLNMYFGALPIIMSKIVWDKLPKEYQELFFECAVEAEELERRRFQEVEQNSLDKFIEHGLTYCEITGEAREEWKEKVISYVYPRYPKIVTDEYLAMIKEYAP